MTVPVCTTEGGPGLQDRLHQVRKRRVYADNDGVDLASDSPQLVNGGRPPGEDMGQVPCVASHGGVEILRNGGGVVDARAKRVLHLDKPAENQVRVDDLAVDRRFGFSYRSP